MFKHKITEGFCREVAKRARRALALTLSFSLLAITTLYAQGSGTPSTLRVKTDANGYLVAAIGAQTNPVTQSTFSQTRLKTDANGYLIIAIGSGSGIIPVANGGTGRATLTIHNVLVGNGTSAVTLVPGCTNGALFWTASSVDPSCNTSPTFTNLTNSGVHFIADGTISNPSEAFTNDTASGLYLIQSGRIGIVNSRTYFTKNGFNNGQSAPDATKWGMLAVNTQGADSGVRIDGYTSTAATSTNAAIEFNGRTYDPVTYPALQFNGFKAAGSGGSYTLNQIPATGQIINLCNNGGISVCDFKTWYVFGQGSSYNTINAVSGGSTTIGTTTTPGHVIQNLTAAANGAQQYSPGLGQIGNGWSTNSGGLSMPIETRFEIRPIQGAAAPTYNYVLMGRVNGGAFSDLLTVNSTGTFNSSANGNFAVGAATGYKISRGTTALDGTNPTTIATGLTTVTSCTGILERNSALTTGTAFLTHDAASGANVDFYGWVIAGTASTGVEVFDWVCVGT